MGLVEGAIIAAWVVLLWRVPAVRALVRDAPRLPVLVLATVLAAWTAIQFKNDFIRFFPLVTWQMYGEVRTPRDVSGVRVEGQGCPGRAAPVHLEAVRSSRGVINRLSELLTRLQSSDTAPERAVVGARIDSLLVFVGRDHNRRHPAQPVCGLRLLHYQVPREAVGRAPIPRPRPVRDVRLD